eukprot:3570708-Amphidinium_carterae.1
MKPKTASNSKSNEEVGVNFMLCSWSLQTWIKGSCRIEVSFLSLVYQNAVRIQTECKAKKTCLVLCACYQSHLR